MTEERLAELDRYFRGAPMVINIVEGARQLLAEIRALRAENTELCERYASAPARQLRRRRKPHSTSDEVEQLRAELAKRDACAMHAAAEYFTKKATKHRERAESIRRYTPSDRVTVETEAEINGTEMLADHNDDLAADLRALTPAPEEPSVAGGPPMPETLRVTDPTEAAFARANAELVRQMQGMVPREVAKNAAAICFRAGQLFERDWSTVDGCVADANVTTSMATSDSLFAADAALARAEKEAGL